MSTLNIIERIIFNNFSLNINKSFNNDNIDLVKIWNTMNIHFFYSKTHPFSVFPTPVYEDSFQLQLKTPIEYCSGNIRKFEVILYFILHLSFL